MSARHVFPALSLLLALCLLSACAPSPSASGRDPIEVGTAMTQAADGLPEMSVLTSQDERGEELFPYLSDLDYSKVDGYYFAYATAGTAEEIAVIRLKDEADVPEAAASLQRHMAGRLDTFQFYDPEQAPMAEDARYLTVGNEVALVVCGSPEGPTGVFQTL